MPRPLSANKLSTISATFHQVQGRGLTQDELHAHLMASGTFHAAAAAPIWVLVQILQNSLDHEY